jgi:hypothetical protein
MADDDDPESQAVRRATLRNDRLVREQAGTLHGHAISEANEGAGRFTAQSRATVVGATAAPAPVAAPNWALLESSKEMTPSAQVRNCRSSFAQSLLVCRLAPAH